MLVDHVDHAANLHLDGADVEVQEDGLASGALSGVENAEGLEHLYVLLGDELVNGLDAGVDAGDAELVGLGGPRRIVAVTVVHHLEVLLEHILRDGDGVLARLDAVRDFSKLLGGERIEHSVDQGHVLGGAHRAELEAMAAVGEGGGAVAILGVARGRWA